MMKHLLQHILPAMMLFGAFAAQAADAVEFSYASGDPQSRVGFQGAGAYGGAMKIDNPDLVGTQLMSVKVYGLPSVPDSITDYRIWTATELPMDTVFSKDNVEVQLVDGSLEYTFPNPITIQEGGLYVGYSFNIPAISDNSFLRFPFPYTKTAVDDNAMILTKDGGWWTDYTSSFGALTIVATMSGDIKENAVSIAKIITCPFAVAGKTTRVTFQLVNGGTQAVKNVEYSYELNGQTITGKKNVTLAGLGARAKFYILFPALSEAGIYPINLNITKVNGLDNASLQPNFNFQLCLPAFSPEKRVVMEEGTGSWCGWCTRGWLAMKLLNAKYPDTFIGAAYHASDAMDVTPVLPMDFGGGYPGCALDRKYNALDPYYGSSDNTELGIETDFNTALKDEGVADIAIETAFNADKTELTVKPSLIFGGMTAGQMKIGYLLIQNKLIIEDNRDFAQSNYYSGRGDNYAADSPLQEICAMEGTILNFQFDDCVINSTYCTGVENSLPAPSELQLKVPYTHEIKFNTKEAYGAGYEGDAEANLCTNPDEMEVVVMLIGSDGTILNARKVKAGGVAESAINNVAVDNDTNVPVEYFNLQGQRINNPTQGIYIMRQGQKTSKVLVR